MSTTPQKMALQKNNYPLALFVDIGGTNVRFVSTDHSGNLNHFKSYSTSDFKTPYHAARAYMESISTNNHEVGVFCIASPISNDHINMTNADWSFSLSELKKDLSFKDLIAVNDISAIAYSIPFLKTEDKTLLRGKDQFSKKTTLTIGIGTGLGVSALKYNDDKWNAIPSEAGHMSAHSLIDIEAEIINFLKMKLGHVSFEHLLSGQGISNIFESLNHIYGYPEEEKSPIEITAEAKNSTCLQSQKTIDIFCSLLGHFCSNCAVTFFSEGGIYLSGGMVHYIGDVFNSEAFSKSLLKNDKYCQFLEETPHYKINLKNPSFIGLKYLLEKNYFLMIS